MDALGDALQGVLALSFVRGEPQMAEDRILDVLRRFEVSAFVDGAEDGKIINNFHDFLAGIAPGANVRVEWPVEQFIPQTQRFLKGWIDLIAVPAGDAPWIIVDHKAWSQGRNTFPDEVARYSGQLKAYRDALMAAHPTMPPPRLFLHFPVSGFVVEVLGNSFATILCAVKRDGLFYCDPMCRVTHVRSGIQARVVRQSDEVQRAARGGYAGCANWQSQVDIWTYLLPNAV